MPYNQKFTSVTPSQKTEESTLQPEAANHIKELTTRIIWCLTALIFTSISSFYWIEEWIALLSEPLRGVPGWSGYFIFTDIGEAFALRIYLSLRLGLLLTLPIVLFHSWLFLRPGLFKWESRRLGSILLLSGLSGLVGVLFGYFFLLPSAWSFFLGFQSQDIAGAGLDLHLESRIGTYLQLTVSLLLGLGIGFQVPLLFPIAVWLGLMPASELAKRRRFFVITAFILAAIISPPDVPSQLIIAGILMFIFEFGIFLILIVESYGERITKSD